MTLETLLTNSAVQSLGRALLHFLWQGALLAALLWIVKAVTPASAARARYAAASIVMLMMPITLIATASLNLRSAREPQRATKSTPPPALTTPQAMAAATRAFILSSPPARKPRPGLSGWSVCIWICGVLLLSLRAFGGWTRAQRLKRDVHVAGAQLEQILLRLTAALRISAPVRLYTSAIVQVPTVVGWLRPYILLPVTALTGLTDSQIRAILAHELAHIRRHDYLVNLLQTAIETVLFYHPAVWWVGKQMRIEREHCCDDIAVAVCGDPVEYATALAELEAVRGNFPEPALAATGGDLLGRIRRLLGEQDHDSRSLGTLAAAAFLLVLAGGSIAFTLRAQEPPAAFEVASIRPTKADKPGPRYQRMSAEMTVESATLKDLILMAYDLKDFQVSEGPSWVVSDRYDIEARGEPLPNDKGLTLRHRLQTLLHDRFKLDVHRETKELPIFELTVAKSGLKLQSAKGCLAVDPQSPRPAAGKTYMDYCGNFGMGRGIVEWSSGDMASIAASLSNITGRIVVNKTGITGAYRVHLTFIPDESLAPLPGPPGEPTNPTPGADGPSLYTALEEQLGLKLESAKGPVEVLVIDHAEKPSEN